jgi:hypothetical protein
MSKPSMSLYVDGKKIEKGTVLKDFRGDPVKFLYVSRDADVDGPSTGRITVSEGDWDREFYPSVVDGVIR